MGFFDIFAHRPQSYHWSASQGRMVKCASTPCRLHDGSDVICSSLEEAETAHAEQVKALERKAREEQERNRVNEDGFRLEWLKTLDPDPDKAARMARNWRSERIIVWIPMRICGRHYMIATNGLAGVCRRCRGTGIDPERKLKSGKPTECMYCSGKGYSTMYGGKAHEAVTDVEPMDDEERSFQRFVRDHGKEFDRFVARAGRAGSYLSDPAVDQTYGPWRSRDMAPMMARQPDEALNLMRSLSDRYDMAEREWEKMKEEDASGGGGLPVMDRPVTAKYPVGGLPTCTGTIIESHDYKDRRTGADMSAYVIYSDGKSDLAYANQGDDSPWVVTVFDHRGYGIGDRVTVTGRITGLDVDDKGMVRERMVPTKSHVTSA